MIYGEVAGIGKPVSRVVQGSMGLSSEALDESFALLDGVFACGCTAFDSAHVYGGGDCERVLGQWIASRGLREQAVVITKGAHPNADRNRVTPFDIAGDLHDSLTRLRTDYIDLYLLHRDDPEVHVGAIVEALNEHVRSGKIHAFGGSNWSHERIAEANEYAAVHGLAGFAASSPNYSLAEMIDPPWPGCVSVSGEAATAARAWYAGQRMPVFAWSSLARGFLSGRFTPEELEGMIPDEADTMLRCFRGPGNLERLRRASKVANEMDATVPQVALAYLLHQAVTVYPIVGAATVEEFRMNAAACGLDLTPETVAWLDLKG